MPIPRAILTLLALVLTCGVVYAQKSILFHPAAGPVSVSSITINSAGTTLTVALTTTATISNANGWTVDFDNDASRTLTYSSGSGTSSLVFTLTAVSPSTDGRAPVGTVCTLDYDAGAGNVSGLADVTAYAVTNNSTAIPDPDLPQNLPDTSLPSGWNGTADHTPADMAALNELTDGDGSGDVQAGDIVELSGTYTGLWTIDDAIKGTAGSPIIFRTSGHAGLPAYGTRITEADDADLATITRSVSQASHYCLKVDKGSGAAGASHIRFIGIKFQATGTYANLSNIIDIGEVNGTTSTTDLPVGIGFNHCKVTCADATEVQEAMRIDATDSFVVDSRFTNLDAGGNDGSTGIRFYVGARMVFENLYIESESAAIFLGGNEQNRCDDVKISGIHNTRQLTWDDSNGVQKAGGLETKCGLRVLAENMFIENATWQQGGFAALAIKSEAGSDGLGKKTIHFTARNIEISNCDSGFYPHIAGSSSNTGYGPNADMLFENILTYDISGYGVLTVPYKSTDSTRFERLQIRHCTIISGSGLIVTGISTGSTPGAYHNFSDNILSGTYGYIVNSGQTGAWALNWGWGSDYTARKNAWVGQSTGFYDTDSGPAPLGTLTGSFFPADIAAVGFEDSGSNDYRLGVGSSLNDAATDGADVGCDVAALNTILSGVVE